MKMTMVNSGLKGLIADYRRQIKWVAGLKMHPTITQPQFFTYQQVFLLKNQHSTFCYYYV